MGIFDKAKSLVTKNKDQVAPGVDKATDVVDDKTGGKHTDHLEKVDDAAQKFADQPDAEAGAADSAAGDEPSSS